MVVWWATEVECSSALARLGREGYATRSAVIARRRLDAFRVRWNEVDPSDAVRRLARRLLDVHTLRAADALQLAAALQAAEESPEKLSFISLDDRLTDAARREGFSVVDLG